MKHPAMAKSLPLLITLSLALQIIWPATAQTFACAPRKCVYLALVSRTPYLLLTHKTPVRRKLDFQVESYVFNTTNTTLKDIVVRAEFIEEQTPIVVHTYTLAYVIAPGEIDQFMVYGGGGVSPPVVNLIAVTWTVALTAD